MKNQDNENLIDFDFEKHQQSIDEENENANYPRSDFAKRVGIIYICGDL